MADKSHILVFHDDARAVTEALRPLNSFELTEIGNLECLKTHAAGAFVMIAGLQAHGIDVAEVISLASKYHPAIPVVAYTEDMNVRAAVDALHLGVSRCFFKPDDEQALKDYIEGLSQLGERSEPGSEGVYQNMANACRDLIAVVDQDYVLVAVNDAFCNAHLKTREILLGRSLTKISDAEVLNSRLRTHLDRCLSGDGTQFTEPLTRGDETVYFQVSLLPYQNAEGEATHAIIVYRDVTVRKTIEEQMEKVILELKQTKEKALEQERLRAVGVMASGMAHDFNNALASILGFSELLLETPENLGDKEKALRYLGFINTEAQDAAKVVNRLSEFYSEGERDAAFEPIDFNRVIEQVIALTQPLWRDQALAAGNTISVSFEQGVVPPVSGLESELREALTNLMLNAVDAIQKRGTIILRTGLRDPMVYVEVVDDGIGMTEDVLSQCLAPFFTSKGAKGSGLGLSMVNGIVQRHKGQMEIESEVGCGATIRLLIPRYAIQPKNAHAATDS